jgi:hypothetical protein
MTQKEKDNTAAHVPHLYFDFISTEKEKREEEKEKDK